MEFEVVRFFDDGDTTLSLLFDVTKLRHFLCYGLEDEHRDVKVAGETCIPAGRYRLALRTENSGMHIRYGDVFDMHMGMIEVMNVPDFTNIYWHIGNDDDDTAGCYLLGDSQDMQKGYVGSSRNAYVHVYPLVANALAKGEQCWVTYTDWGTLCAS